MNFPKRIRRQLLAAAAALGLGFGLAAPAVAMDKLSILVPAAPGGGWDQTGRALQAAIQSANLVKRVTVDNRGGAGGTIGLAGFVSSSKGDPSAVMIGGMVMVGAIYSNNSPVNLSQVTPLARLTGEPGVIVVPGNSKITSMKELAAQLKANTASVSWGAGSAGGSDHILAGLVAQAVGADVGKLNYIAYAGGGEAQAAVMGGHVTAGISGYNEFAGQIKSGKLKALALSSAERLPGVDIPTLKELGINVELINWRGIFGAPGITDAQTKALIDVLDKTVKTPAWQETLTRNQWADLYLAGDAFKTFLDADTARITKVMDGLGLGKK